MWLERWAQPSGPWRTSWSLTMTLPAKARMKVKIATATGRRTPSGVVTNAMSLFVQVGTSTLSKPTPNRATTESRPLCGTLLGPKRGTSRISASTSSRAAPGIVPSTAST